MYAACIFDKNMYMYIYIGFFSLSLIQIFIKINILYPFAILRIWRKLGATRYTPERNLKQDLYDITLASEANWKWGGGG